LDMLLANTFVSIDIDGSISSKSEFLASIKSPDYQASQAVTEQSSVQVYGGCRRSRRSVSNQGDGEREALRAPRTISRYLDQAPWSVAVCGHDEHADHSEMRAHLRTLRSPQIPFCRITLRRASVVASDPC
jgi:hypothetical protein